MGFFMQHVVCFTCLLLFVSSCMSKREREPEILLESGKVLLVSSENTSLYSMPNPKTLAKDLEALKAELASDKKNIAALNRIVDILFFQKKYKEALSYAKQILFHQGSNPKIRLKIAHAAVRMRKYPFAEFVLSQLPCEKDSDCSNLQGVIAYNKGQIKEALDYFKRALNLSTKNISASLNLALLYMEFYKFDDASEQIKKISRQAPRDQHVKLMRAVLLMIQKKFDNAEDILEELYAKNRNNPVILHNLSANALKMRDYERALKLVNRALKNAPKYTFTLDKSIKLKEEIVLKKKDGG